MLNIRNFSIIAHIDHGKSTLADRMLEITNTIDKRKMKDQVLDNMELERERGITIKMQPVRMNFVCEGKDYILNLIDTPGHIDFSYEVSRALKAVEGTVLLVDATQGVQAQTMTTLSMAQKEGLTIIPVVSKIDSPLADIEKVKAEIITILGCDEKDILMVSGRTGDGVKELLNTIITKVPPPKIDENNKNDFRGLIFDFNYSSHKGIVVYLRVIDGTIKKNDSIKFIMGKENCIAQEVGIFSPQPMEKDSLTAGEIGYIITGVKKPGIASVGDTIAFSRSNIEGLGGYQKPVPVVWASIYPSNQDHFPKLTQALDRLKLSDSSFTYEMESSTILGRGFRCGFLGMLHLEIITERLKREFDLDLIITMPSITYKVTYKNNSQTGAPAKEEIVYSPYNFPDEGTYTKCVEPWVNVSIMSPMEYVGAIVQLLYHHEAELGDTVNFGDNRARVNAIMPLREMMRNFFDNIKSTSSGYASISYEMAEHRDADVARLDILVNGDVVPAFSKVLSKRQILEEAKKSIEKLAASMPRQQINIKMQAYGLGRILCSDSITAFKKDVTQHMYGGDITRRMKLWEKQKKGKKKMQSIGKVNIPESVFVSMIK